MLVRALLNERASLDQLLNLFRISQQKAVIDHFCGVLTERAETIFGRCQNQIAIDGGRIVDR
ncbi:hypothetical protein SS05631_b52920 (plasmid) [Sinorhizobium sp. CCBAU 05631]|nr:hypothetical protein SS05631_b52920 [Sinorhizobium sp. CCBAU 05631]